MKKLIISLALILGFVFTSAAQDGVTLIRTDNDVYLTRNYDIGTLSGSDTSFIFSMRKPVSQAWSIQLYWYGVTGEGSVALEVTNFKTLSGWVAYTGSVSTTITGASGYDGWEDTIMAWDYCRLKLTKGTLSGGRLTAIIRIK